MPLRSASSQCNERAWMSHSLPPPVLSSAFLPSHLFLSALSLPSHACLQLVLLLGIRIARSYYREKKGHSVEEHRKHAFSTASSGAPPTAVVTSAVAEPGHRAIDCLICMQPGFERVPLPTTTAWLSHLFTRPEGSAGLTNSAGRLVKIDQNFRSEMKQRDLPHRMPTLKLPPKKKCFGARDPSLGSQQSVPLLDNEDPPSLVIPVKSCKK